MPKKKWEDAILLEEKKAMGCDPDPTQILQIQRRCCAKMR